MTRPPLADVPVRSAADLTRRWATLLDPPVFSARSLWLAWLDTDGRMLPIVVPVDELPPLPEWSTLSGLLTLHDAVAEQTGWAEGHLAFALCRPGPATVVEDDAEWADALESELDGMLDGTWSLHLAAAGRVLPVVSPPWSGRAGTTRSSTLR
jgi:hypothetical protein